MLSNRPLSKLMVALILSLGLSALTSCQSDYGTLTVLNTGDAPLKGQVGEHKFQVKPGKSWSKIDLPVGETSVIVTGGEELPVTIQKDLTTHVDPSGQNCFVVADYQQQYGPNPGSAVDIVERIELKKVFTPKASLQTTYGRKLPSQLPEGSPARRVHLVDCKAVKDNDALVKILARIP